MSKSPKHGMLRGLFLNSPDQIRRLMRGLSRNLLNPIKDPHQPDLPNMQLAERFIATRILRTIRAYPNNPLLLEATLLFVFAVDKEDQAVISAARKFESLAAEEVLTKPVLYIPEYSEARARFNEACGTGAPLNTNAHLQSIAPGAFLAIEQSEPDSSNSQPKSQTRCKRCISRNTSCSRDQPACMECRNTFAGPKCHYPVTSREDEQTLESFQEVENILEGAISTVDTAAPSLKQNPPQTEPESTIESTITVEVEIIDEEAENQAKKTPPKPTKQIALALAVNTRDSKADKKPKPTTIPAAKNGLSCGTCKGNHPASDFVTNPNTGLLYKTCIRCQANMKKWLNKQKEIESEEDVVDEELESPEEAERVPNSKRLRDQRDDDGEYGRMRSRRRLI